MHTCYLVGDVHGAPAPLLRLKRFLCGEPDLKWLLLERTPAMLAELHSPKAMTGEQWQAIYNDLAHDPLLYKHSLLSLEKLCPQLNIIGVDFMYGDTTVRSMSMASAAMEVDDDCAIFVGQSHFKVINKILSGKMNVKCINIHQGELDEVQLRMSAVHSNVLTRRQARKYMGHE